MIAIVATLAVVLGVSNPVAIESGETREIGPAVNSTEAAIAIGKIYLKSRYSDGDVEGSGPYTAIFEAPYWLIEGYRPPMPSIGGTLTVKIDGRDGRLIQMTADE